MPKYRIRLRRRLHFICMPPLICKVTRLSSICVRTCVVRALNQGVYPQSQTARKKKAFPTQHFTILELQNPSIDVSAIHKIRHSIGFEALKL